MEDYNDRVINIFTKHPRQTQNPQSYCKHGIFAICNSLNLIIGGLAGIIHGICPKLFPFYTSMIVIQSFKKVIKSGRHNNEILYYLNEDMKDKKIIIKSDPKAPDNERVKNIQITISINEI
jgi:hypothetical protein